MRSVACLLALGGTGCLVPNPEWGFGETDAGGSSIGSGADTEGSTSASESGSSDSLGDGDGDTASGDGTTGDGDGTTTAGDGDGSTGDGDGSTGDGDGSTGDGDGDGTTGDGDGSTGDGDGSTGDGDGDGTTGDGDGTTGDGDGDGTTGDGDGVATPGCGNGGPAFPGDVCYGPVVVVPLPSMAHPHFVAAADFDHDGRVDVAAVDKFVEAAQLLWGDGQSLVFGAAYGNADLPEGITAGLISADAWPDLVIARPVGTDTIGILINDGTGAMGPQETRIVGGDVRDVQLVDANLDGRMDLAYANRADNLVGILHQDLGGSFGGVAVEHPVCDDPSDLVVANMNMDLLPDIVVVCLQGTVDVLLAEPGGSFGLPTSFDTSSIGGGPEGIAVADVDGDSDQDIAIIDRGDDVMGVLVNDGLGALSGGTPLAVGQNPRGVAFGDFDSDGDADLVSADHDGGTLTVYLNDGGGAFTFEATYAIGADPRQVVTADLNGDGADEMIAALHLDEAVGVIWSNH